MIDSYKHYISKNIRAFYRRRLPLPLLLLLALIGLWFVLPLPQMRYPYRYQGEQTLTSVYNNGTRYAQASLENLHFTGYTKQLYDYTTGYFYYGQSNHEYFIILLSPRECQEGIPTIESITTSVKFVKGGDTLNTLYQHMAEDLDWTITGISNTFPAYYLSNPGYNTHMVTILFAFYFAGMLYCIGLIVLYLLYIAFPFLSPAVLNLLVYGNPLKQFAQAEEELETLPQLATEDMFITEHYFIMSSPYKNVVIPIQEILWLYKYSTLHKIFWYHHSISYTLQVTGNKHFHFHSPRNAKSDIDGIIDYLSEANHDILVGFNEKNRKAVQTLQGKSFQREFLRAVFRRK